MWTLRSPADFKEFMSDYTMTMELPWLIWSAIMLIILLALAFYPGDEE
jgi:Na+/melibiose symporter-like transporter